jgi:hypothetical protein
MSITQPEHEPVTAADLAAIGSLFDAPAQPAATGRLPLTDMLDFRALERLSDDATTDDYETALMALRESMPPDLDDLSRESARQMIRSRFPKVPARMVAAATKRPPAPSRDISLPVSKPSTTSPDPMAIEIPEADRLPLAALLEGVKSYTQKYIALPAHGADVLSLWVAHTFALDAFEATPYLHVTAATMQAGKTRVLEVLEPLVPRPWFTGRTTPAALARKIDAETPTLLLDESDAAFKVHSEFSETLRGVLNSGYRRSGRVTVCTGKSTEMTTTDFRTFCAKAIAGIGSLPDTVMDRSIRLELKRRTKTEPVAKLRMRAVPRETATLKHQLSAWARYAVPTLRDMEPQIPEALSDRAADVWESLIAIADLAGAEWPSRARTAAVAMTVTQHSDPIQVELLRDVQAVFADKAADFMPSADLAAALAALADRPWGEWSGGRPLSASKLARQLQPFGIVPDQHRTGARVQRGYRQASFIDAWARYLPETVTPVTNPMNTGSDPQFSEVLQTPVVTASKPLIQPMITGLCHGVTVSTPENDARAMNTHAGDDDAERF